MPVVLGALSIGPGLLVAVVLGASLAFLAARADIDRLARWAVGGGWFVFALTSPTAEFPTFLRPVGVVLAFVGVILLRFGRPKAEVVKERLIPFTTKLLFIYLTFVMIGCLASPYGPKNLIRGVQGTMVVLTAFYAASLGVGRILLTTTFLASLANVALTVKSGAGEVLYNGDHTSRLAGFMQPNHLAFACAVVIIAVVWLFPTSPRLRIPLVGCALLATYALLASQSRTALSALLAGLGAGICATYFVHGRRGRAAAWILLAGLVMVPLVLPAFGTWFNRDKSSSSITSLTGRTDFWPFAVELIKERPVIGWGTDVILSPYGAKFQKVLPGVSEAHNSYLEAALIAGLPGALAWASCLLGITVGAFKLRHGSPYRFLLISFGIVIELFAITESSPAFFGDMFIIFVLCAAYYGESRAGTFDADPVGAPALVAA